MEWNGDSFFFLSSMKQNTFPAFEWSESIDKSGNSEILQTYGILYIRLYNWSAESFAVKIDCLHIHSYNSRRSAQTNCVLILFCFFFLVFCVCLYKWFYLFTLLKNLHLIFVLSREWKFFFSLSCVVCKWFSIFVSVLLLRQLCRQRKITFSTI